jgi:hypothetical protein
MGGLQMNQHAAHSSHSSQPSGTNITSFDKSTDELHGHSADCLLNLKSNIRKKEKALGQSTCTCGAAPAASRSQRRRHPPQSSRHLCWHARQTRRTADSATVHMHTPDKVWRPLRVLRRLRAEVRQHG